VENEATKAADLQLCTRIYYAGRYHYAGFEDDRFSSPVHNSLANSTLLDRAAKNAHYIDCATEEPITSLKMVYCPT